MQTAPTGRFILIVMGHQHGRNRLSCQFAEHPLTKISAQINVETIKRFIQQQRSRLGQQDEA